MSHKFSLDEQPEFNIPQQILDKLYEFSGGADKYKGVVIAYVSENGVPLIYSRFDSAITELGLNSAIGHYLDAKEDEFIMPPED